MTEKQSEDLETDRPGRSVSPYQAGLKCVCPACGETPLFHNVLEVHATCPGCSFDLSSADPGDGAQVFVILILGGLSALLGTIMYGVFQLPVWLIVTLLSIVVLAGSIWMLRVFKATLIALQFHHDAHEGHLIKGDQDNE